MPPGVREKIQRRTVERPTLKNAPGNSTISEGTVSITCVIPPAMFAVTTATITPTTTIRQPKIKSVHATVFRPEGMMKNRLSTAIIIMSALIERPVMGE